MRPRRLYRRKLVASPRDEILSAWRGESWRRSEADRNAPIQSAATLIPKVLVSMRLEDRAAATQLLRIWQTTIDPTLTAHAQPAGFAKGTLFVNVDSNAWLAEILRYHRKEILHRLQLAVGSDQLKKISYRHG